MMFRRGKKFSPHSSRAVWANSAYLFVLPTLVFVFYFIYYPLGNALFGAFTDWDGFNPPRFIGLANFERAFADRALQRATTNNIIWALGYILLALVPPFIAAELIFHVRSRRWQYLYRTLFVVPLMVPHIVFILLWTYFYRSDGLLNQALGEVGLGGWKQLWIADPQIALYSLMLMGFPWIAPFNLLIFYAGLQTLSGEVLDAAALDGAKGWRRIWHIDLPHILPQVRLLFVLALIGSVQNILAPLLMTGGGPGYATYVPILHMYKVATDYGQFGYSMAISCLLFVVVLLPVLFNRRIFGTRVAD